MVMSQEPPKCTEATSQAFFPKVTRHQLAAHLALSLRYVDELTRCGKLPFFRIGKSIRYDVAEVEAALRSRFLVRAKAGKSAGKKD